jgi:hypothetical protein
MRCSIRFLASLVLAAACAAAIGWDALAQQQQPRRPNRPNPQQRNRPNRPANGEIITPAAPGERHPDRLRVGDAAPDFTLPKLDGEGKVTLSSFRGKKPVVLVFGSYTWPPFRRQSGDLERLYQTYRDRAEFLLVYIREAHPDSVLWVDQDGGRALQKIEQTDTLDQRVQTAEICVSALKLSMPTVIDGADNTVNRAYSGWPDRLIVVGVDGKIAYYGGPGPRGFRPEEVEAWLKENLDRWRWSLTFIAYLDRWRRRRRW